MTGPARDRYDRTLRVVMWLDAFLSLATVMVCLVALPVVAVFDVPAGLRLSIGLTAVTMGALLAGFGAVTAVALMLRTKAGTYTLPIGLRLPLPRPMCPDIE